MRARVAGFLASLFLLFALPAAPASDAAEQPLRIGVTASDAFAEAYYAQQLGLFKRAGLSIDLVPFTTGAAVATGVASGEVSVGVSNVALLAREVARGTPLLLIAAGGLYSAKAPISALCALKTTQLREAKDFEGKTIAITAIGDQTQIGVSAWLQKGGADVSKVHFIAISFKEMSMAVQSGIADAAMITEPWLSAAQRTDGLRAIARPYDAVAPQFLIGVWFTTPAWYAKNTALAKRFAGVIYETGRWANAHHDQTAALLSSYAKIDVASIRSATRAPYATELSPELIQPQLDLAYKFHAIDRSINANDIIAR